MGRFTGPGNHPEKLFARSGQRRWVPVPVIDLPRQELDVNVEAYFSLVSQLSATLLLASWSYRWSSHTG